MLVDEGAFSVLGRDSPLVHAVAPAMEELCAREVGTVIPSSHYQDLCIVTWLVLLITRVLPCSHCPYNNHSHVHVLPWPGQAGSQQIPVCARCQKY